MLARQTAGGLRRALAPKLSGALNAAAGLRQQPLQQALLFSSVAALLGNAGQANYSAANAALDAAAALWQQHGTPAGSLQWGPWAGGGMATASVAASLAAKGVGLVQPAGGLRLLARLLAPAASLPAVAAPLVALDWRRMLRPAQQRSPFFAELVPAGQPAAGPSPAAASSHSGSAPAPRISLQQVEEQLLQLVAGVVGGAVDRQAAFMSAGLDSLGEPLTPTCLPASADALGCPGPFSAGRAAQLLPLIPPLPTGAVELRNAVAARFAVDLPATVTFDHPTPASLAAFVHAQLPAEAAAEGSSGAAEDSGAWGAPSQPAARRARRRGAATATAAASTGSQARAAAVLQQLSEVAAGVLGSAPAPDQPLMEVRGG